MRFSFWFYLCKGWVLFFPLAISGFVFRDRHPVFLYTLQCSVALILFAGVIGALLAVGMVCGWLRMICPFCGRAGRVGADREHGLWMACDHCSFIHGGGFLGLRLMREPWDYGEAEDTD